MRFSSPTQANLRLHRAGCREKRPNREHQQDGSDPKFPRLMSAFYLPGVNGDEHVIEAAYRSICEQIEAEMGRPPTPRRIASVWTRRGSVDCVTEVGEQDPLRGGIVMAIFDMGHHQPFLVWRQPADEDEGEDLETLGCNAYSVSEFDL
jgi:hypothetical protein